MTNSEAAKYDAILIERIKNGEHSVYNDMVERYWDRIYARVNHLLKNKDGIQKLLTRKKRMSRHMNKSS